jgi:hypothetical protein
VDELVELLDDDEVLLDDVEEVLDEELEVLVVEEVELLVEVELLLVELLLLDVLVEVEVLELDVALLDDVLLLVLVDVLELELELVDDVVTVVVVTADVGQAVSTIGTVAVRATLNVFVPTPVGEFVTTPPAAPPKLTQYVSPPLIVNRMPPSVPMTGGTTVTCGCGPGPSAPFRVTFTVNVPLFDFLTTAAFTGPTTPVESL